MKKKRMSPYELEEDIFAAVEGRRWATRQNWREVHKEALLLWVEKHKDVASLIPSPADVGGSFAPAPNVERPQNLGDVAITPAVPAVGLSAVGVPVPELTENEKRLERLIQRRATKQAFLDEAPLELAREPGSLRALNWLKVMPKEVASYDLEIEACKAAIEAERLAKESSGASEVKEEV